MNPIRVLFKYTDSEWKMNEANKNIQNHKYGCVDKTKFKK